MPIENLIMKPRWPHRFFNFDCLPPDPSCRDESSKLFIFDTAKSKTLKLDKKKKAECYGHSHKRSKQSNWNRSTDIHYKKNQSTFKKIK